MSLKNILSAWLICVSSLAFAQEESSFLNLNRVLDSVDQHFPLVLGAVQDQEKAKGDLLSAQGGFDPVLKSSYQATPLGQYENRYFETFIEQPTPFWGTRVFAGYRNGQGQFAPYDGKFLTNSDGEMRIGIGVPILRGGLTDDRRARIGVSERGLEAAEKSVDLQRLDSRRQASYRYFEWVTAGEKQKVAQSLLKLALDRDNVMRYRVLRGDAAKVEQIDNQRSVAQRQASLVSATRAFQKATLELSLYYRDEKGKPILANFEDLPKQGLEVPVDIPDSLAGEHGEAFAAEVIRQHPEVLRLQALLAQNEIELKLSRNQILPRLDADFAFARDLGFGSSARSTPEFTAAIKLEFPILFRSPVGKNRSVIAQGAKLDAQLDLARDRIRVAISDAFQAIEATRQRISLAEEELEFAVKVEEAERVKLKHGDSNILTVNLREQATAEANFRKIDALADFYRAHADLTVAIARNQI